MSSTVTPSYSSSSARNNYESASAVLANKLVRHRRCPFNAAALYYDFRTEWENFSRICGSRTAYERALQLLEDALREEYLDEAAFNDGLFHALHEALGNECCSIVSQNKRMIIRFKDARCWGFATQVTNFDIFASGAKNEHENSLDVSAESTSSRSGSDAVLTRSRFDHACVLFEPSIADRNKMTDVTVMIELKLSNTSCSHFKINKDYILMDDLKLPSIHGPVAQVLCYTLNQVHPSLTQNNVQGVDMPFFVLAGLKKDRQGAEFLKTDQQVAHTKLHYVQGELHVPKSFSAPFEFSILRGGMFDEFKQAAASYIKILLHRALLAEKIKMTKNHYPSAMLCSCQHKINGWSIDSCKLIASPILNKNRFSVIT